MYLKISTASNTVMQLHIVPEISATVIDVSTKWSGHPSSAEGEAFIEGIHKYLASIVISYRTEVKGHSTATKHSMRRNVQSVGISGILQCDQGLWP